jgi:nitrate reductase molybdenum cofactor assembly chaperone
MLPEESKKLCQLFAEVLDYPGSSLLESATECVNRLEHTFPGTVGPIQSFVTFAQSQNPGTLEELYTQTFDVTPATTPYVGYHLFGETPKRSAFMAKLQEAYQAHGFSAGAELADHLCVLLRFFSVAQDPEFVIPLLQECVLPVLEKMEEAFPKNGNGYAPAVSSLRLFLRQVCRRLIKTGGLPHD